jgi:hypothetical protein
VSGAAFLAVMAAGARPPSPSSPEALIDAIYKKHDRTKSSPGIDLAEKSVIACYFEPTRAKAIDNDERGNPQLELYGGPLTNSRHRYFSGVKMDMGPSSECTATATVSFPRERDRTRTMLRYDMIKEAKG